MLEVAPHWLVVVEGIEGRVPGQRLATHWWGGNLEGVRRAPVRLARPGRLVYSPHEYGPGVFPQPWFSTPDMAAQLERRWRLGFGYIAEEGIAPILVGEFGGRDIGPDTVEGRWQRQFLGFLGRTGASWTYWALNPNSGDTGGVLTDDWTTVDEKKMSALRTLIGRRRQDGGPAQPAPFGRRPADPPRGARPPVYGPPPPEATPAPAPGPARTGARRVRLVMESRWGTGWCARLEIGGLDAGLGGRVVVVELPEGAAVSQVWNAATATDGARIRLTLPGWAKATAAAPYTSTGFCATGAGEPGAVRLE